MNKKIKAINKKIIKAMNEKPKPLDKQLIPGKENK